jgi:hypothetical protein
MAYEKLKPGAEIPIKFKRWWAADKQATADWRDEAREMFRFVAGRQWRDEDLDILDEEGRPALAFNRLGVIVDVVSGHEIQNRQQVIFLPREEGDVIANEIYTEAARWFEDRADAEDEDSEAFRDTVICGMGWTESRMEFDEDPDGAPAVERIDPLEMFWDAGAKRENLKDSRRRWRMKPFTKAEAEEMFPDAKPEDLDATSWTGMKDVGFWINDPTNRYETEPDDFEMAEGTDQAAPKEKVVQILQLQFWVWEPYYKLSQGPDLSEEEFERIKDQLPPNSFLKLRRRKFYNAFLGNKVLECEPSHCQEDFTWACITGKRDRDANCWYGLVRSMKDPQEWANKWLSQMLQLINAQAQGGAFYESGVFANQEQAENDWSVPNALIEVQAGALQNKRLQERALPSFPASLQVLNEFAINAIRESVGVSMEMMGMREADQPGVLEFQRKQANLTVLATLFNSFRRYRKNRGKIMLYFIEEYLSDGRLFRIVGDRKAKKYMKLIKQADTKYDVVIDDAPTSPNQKEMVWQALMMVLPPLKDVIPPKVLLALLEYSPIPGTVVDKIKEAAAPTDEEKEKAALGKAMAQAELGEVQAKSEKMKAEAQKIINEITTPPEDTSEEASQLDYFKAGIEARLGEAKAEAERAKAKATVIESMAKALKIRADADRAQSEATSTAAKTPAEVDLMSAQAYKARKDADKPPPKPASGKPNG